MNDSTENSRLILPALSLCRRELVRFIRQPNRVIGALATPLVFWIVIGLGMGRSFQAAGSMSVNGGYAEYFFPGTILMILLFTAIFSTISIIEDRREGFLQSVLVAPISREAIVLGKVLGGTLLAFSQGVIFLMLSPLIGVHLTILSTLAAMVIMFVVSFGLTALGFCIAWRMSSTQGFHAIMNLFLMPMWFLSGALFPVAGAWKGLKILMNLNPLTYGLAGLRRSLYWGDANISESIPTFNTSVLISILFAAVMFAAASFIAGGRVSADLQ